MCPPRASGSGGVSAAREDILWRIRAALSDGPTAESVQRDYATSWSGGDAVELFAQRVTEYGATVRRVADVVGAIAMVFAEQGARRIAVPPDLPEAWRPDAVDLVVDRGLSPRALDELDGSISGCAVAIAETGTIVLDGGPRQGRRALTLIPDLHVCVVEAAQIVGSVPEGIAALDGSTRPITLVSGPSATSDIELERVEGVHGPRRLVVLIAV